MDSLRKIGRAMAILALTTAGVALTIDAVFNGPGEFKVWIATGLFVAVFGLVATWFWSPFG